MEQMNSRKPGGQANPNSFAFAPDTNLRKGKIQNDRSGGSGVADGLRVRQLNNKGVTPNQMVSSKINGKRIGAMGGTMQHNVSSSKLTQAQLQRSQHAMSKESLLKPQGNLFAQTPQMNSSKVTKKPFNRLVPVPPPQSFLTGSSEEPKTSKVQNYIMEEQKKAKVGTADSSTQGRQVASAFGRSRVSTAKSTTSLFSTDAKMMSQTQ